MMKLNINKMELPVFDTIQAIPFCIPLEDNKNLYFDIPNVKKYFKFEANYLGIIHTYFTLFSDVMFCELKDFADMELKQKMAKELLIVLQNMNFQKDFVKIIVKYFRADFNIKKILSIINPIQLSYLFLFIHNIIENVKKNFQQVLGRLNQEMSGIFSTSLKASSGKIEPRF